MQDILEFFKTIGNLKRVKRTGWVLKGIKEAESVADHTYRVAVMCMILGKKRRLDMRKLLDMALIHDLGETATSDIRYEEGGKIIASEKAKNKIEEDILRRTLPATGDGEYYLSLWHEFRDQSSPEAMFLKQVEKLEMALQALEYQEFGTKKVLLNEFFENARKYIIDPELKQLLEEIEETR